MSRMETFTGYEGKIGNSYYHTPLYLPCPHATWTLWCPYVETDECKKCPAKEGR